MAQTINGARKMIVKSAIKDYIEQTEGDFRPGTPEYDDLMQNVENQVQAILEEEGEIEY